MIQTTSAYYSKHYTGEEAGFGIQERTKSAEDKLDRRSQERLTKIGIHMERGRGSGP